MHLHILMVSTSFPVETNPSSGIFVKKLSDALSHHTDITILTPCARNNVLTYTKYNIHCFRYAPRDWQQIAHNPGGIPVAIKTNPLLALLLPIFVTSLFVNVIRLGRNVDIIHANWSFTGLVTGVAAALIRKPVVTTLRGADANSLYESRISRMAMSLVFKTNRAISCVSASIANDLERIWPRYTTRIHAIPNGVDKQLLTIEHKNDARQLLTISSLIPRKDIATILRAISKTSNINLRIIGEGSERQSLERIANDLQITDRIYFVGGLPPENIAKELAESSLFILSSRSEGRPNALIEAMAAGCAIIATNLPGIRELIENNKHGLLFEPGDHETLAKHIKTLKESDHLRHKYGKSARQRIYELGLTWESSALAYLNLYNEIIGEN